MSIRLNFRVNQLRRLAPSGYPHFLKVQWGSVQRRIKSLRWRASHHARKLVGNAKLPSLDSIVYIASLTYKPKPVSSPTLLFRCSEWPVASAGDPYFGWRSLLTGWHETIEIPGDHIGIFREAGAERMAKEIKVHMQKAETMNWAAAANSD